ncbi:MAG TPA: hypothetical protein VMW19_14365 [Myxococcota bacterium]|nr:hypothetical protein [Myxococcota bacterium]
MPRLQSAALLLWTALAVPLGAVSASAQTVPLSGFGDFSSARTQLVFDDLGLASGDPVSVSGVTLMLSDGSAPSYYEDSFPRESGIDGVGCLANFLGVSRPYPDLDVDFAGPMQKVGFEARVNDADQVSVSLYLAGALVDQVTVPSRGSDQLYFYGYENPAGFDRVVVQVVANASGAFTLDNLTFEAVGTPPPDPGPDPTPDPGPDPGPAPGPMKLSCDGFDAFPHVDHGRDLLPVRALLAELTDAQGVGQTDHQLESAPKLRVMYTPDGGGASMDVTDRVVWRSSEFSFLGRRLQRWFVWVLPWHMRGYGTYMATLESGDPSAYSVDPTCVDWTINKPPVPVVRHSPPPPHGRGH